MNPAVRGVVVLFAGLGLTTLLGTLVTLVHVAAELLVPVSAGGPGWSVARVSLPFSVALACLMLGMVVGGRVQDRLGPRWVATAGAVLVGLGLIVASIPEPEVAFTTWIPLSLTLGVGLMVGSGAGLTLAAAVPPTVKWSPPQRRGAVIGVVLAGVATGPLWLSQPVGAWVAQRGVSSALLFQGLIVLAAMVVLALQMEDPLPGYVPPGSYSDPEGPMDSPVPWAGPSTAEMLKSSSFWALWGGCVVLGAAVVVAVLPLVLAAAGGQAPTTAALLALVIGGALGGVVFGAFRDRLGLAGSRTIAILLVGALAGGTYATAGGSWAGGAALTAACWAGGVVSSWTSTFECFGIRNAGANFGLVTTGWFVGVTVGASVALSASGAESLAGRGVAGWQVAVAAALLAVVLVYLSTLVHPTALVLQTRSSRRPRPS